MTHKFIAVFMVALVWFGSSLPAVSAAEIHEFRYENVLGTSLQIRIDADSEAAARWAESRVLTEIDRQAAIFSTYSADSELSRWLRETSQEATPASRELLTVMQASDRWRTKSQGAFNPSVQVLTQMWSDCAKRSSLPSKDELAKAARNIKEPAWRIDSESRSATRLNSNPLTFNAIAKGFIVDACCSTAFDQERGVAGLLVSIGGDMRACGSLTETVGIADPKSSTENSLPLTSIRLHDRALATSGNYRRGFQIEGHWYSHIIDPRTGWPVDHILSASVLAPSTMDADALATILNVLPPEDSLQLVSELKEIECLIVTRDGRILCSSGWPNAEPTRAQFALADEPRKGADDSKPTKDEPKPSNSNTNSSKKDDQKPADKKSEEKWNGGMELEVKFEINRPEGFFYDRPYIAIWVENQNDQPVRTLVLWMADRGESWLRDLRRWNKMETARQLVAGTDLIRTVSSATRKPGKYEALWDGKNDAGDLVKPGEYTIFIEAAREHGTYQLIRKKVTIGDKPFQFNLAGNVEIKAASLEYRQQQPATTPSDKPTK